jgi:hypothetical protein
LTSPQTNPLNEELPVTTHPWIRRLFVRAPRTIRKAPARFRPALEPLEDRLAPAVVVTRLSDNAMFASIQAAINDAGTVAGTTLRVSAGTDFEQVTINKSVNLQGAQHGVDARSPSRTGLPATETVMDASGNAGKTPFNVTANNVTIDGFTVENETSANVFGFGILLGAGTSGSHVLNNIIQNNIAGLSLANNATAQTVIQNNLFRNNNRPGPVSGTAIYTDQFNAGGALTNVLIDSNTFSGDSNASVLLGSTQLGSQSNITISANTFTNEGNAVFVGSATSTIIFRNTIRGSLGSQIAVVGGVNGLSIMENLIDNGATNGVRIFLDTADGFTGTNQNIKIADNHIQGNATAGLQIDAAAGSYTGVLDDRFNWWGSATGPTTASNPGGTGDKLIDPNTHVRFQPWLTSATDSQPATPGFQGDLTMTAGHVLTVTGATFSTVVGALFNGSVAQVTDNDPFETQADLTATIQWGDGSTTAGNVSGPTGGPFTVRGSHTYSVVGTFHPIVTLTGAGVTNGTALVTATVASVGGDIVVQGTPGGDTLIVFRTPGGAEGSLTYVLNNGPPVALTGVHSFTLRGVGGSDTMTVSFINGGPLVPGGIIYGGGSARISLIVDAAGKPVNARPGEVSVADPQAISYTNVNTISLNNTAAVGAMAGPDTRDRASAFAGLSAQERFVQALYLDALGRPGSLRELDGWVAFLKRPGGSDAAVAAGITDSPEARTYLVRSWYVAFLRRHAQRGEEQFWVNLLLAGSSEEAVLGGILASAEFSARAQALVPSGTADQRYIQALYQRLLSRTGEDQGVRYWSQVLAQQGRQAVALGILQSAEFRTDQFEGYYNALLQRPDDRAGLAFWVSSGLDLNGVRRGFQSSPEYITNS